MSLKRKSNRRRCRNKKKPNSNNNDPQQFAKLKENFNQARLEAFRDYEESLKIEEGLSQSVALKRAQSDQEQECTVYVTNIDFKTSAKDLANWLINAHLKSMGSNNKKSYTLSSQSIISCEILKQKDGKHKGKSSGKAIVQFASKHAFQQVQKQNFSQSRRLSLQGRRIQLRQGYREKNHPDQCATKSFEVSKVQIGHSVDLDNRSRPSSSNVQVYWQSQTSSSSLTLEFNGAKKALSIRPCDNLRLEFELRHIVQLRVGINEDGKRVVIIQFRIPPCCFRAIRLDSNVSAEEQFINLTLRDLNTASSTRDDANYWCSADDVITGDEEYDWIRTIDPTGGPTLSRCRTYRLIFDHGIHSIKDRVLLKCFRDFFIKTAPDSSLFSCPCNGFFSFNQPKHDWCGGFPIEFSDLKYSTSYLLHVMLSNSLLIMPTDTIASDLGQNFRQASAEIVNGVLKYFIASRFATSCERLMQNIQCKISQSAFNDGESFFEHGTRTQDDYDDLRDIVTQRVLVTPTRTCPQLPVMEQSNRILRQFHRHSHRFLRVSFVDENFGSILHALSDDIAEKRIRRLMHDGVYVGGQKFVFLHYSSSQLREQSCWFYNESRISGSTAADFPSALDVRQFMGQSDCKSIRVIGKHASRMGQGFSASVPTVSIQPEMKQVIDDVERNGFCFSDGVGYISSSLANHVASMLDFDHHDGMPPPSAYQIRIGGAKGVVSVFDKTVRDERAQGLTLRPSMIKFESQNSLDLEVLSYSKPMRCYLSRQIITILSSLGIRDEVFQARLDDMIDVLSNCLTSTEAALDFAIHSVDEDNMVYLALLSGFDITKDRHLRGILQAQRNRFTLDLELKARIHIPNGVNLLGILDETNTLPYGTVFFQFIDPATKEHKMLPSGTKVAVYRSPCLHPGDVRLVTVADSPALRHWMNVIVFPQQGERPHPNEMSGGDLDGDIYSILYDEDLVPSAHHDAMPVDSISSLAGPKITVSGRVTTNEIADFFVDYIQNDNLGRIANAHCALADYLPDGVKSPACIKFAKSHSTAVDFAKTGIPAKFPRELVPKKYPDFMQNTLKESYVSTKVLGKIYRSVKELTYTHLTDVPDGSIDKSLVLPGSEKYLEDAQATLLQYNQELWEIMRRHCVEDEQSLLSGFVKEFSQKISTSRTRHGHAQARLNGEITSLKREFRHEFWSNVDEEDEHDAMTKISAWYQVVHEHSARREKNEPPPLISFPWVMHDMLCKIKQLKGCQSAHVSTCNSTTMASESEKVHAIAARQDSKFIEWR